MMALLLSNNPNTLWVFQGVSVKMVPDKMTLNKMTRDEMVQTKLLATRRSPSVQSLATQEFIQSLYFVDTQIRGF